MEALRKLITGVAVTGLLVGGAGPAVAGGDDDRYDNETIKVLVFKEHTKKHHSKWELVEHETLSLKKAARYAHEECDDGSYRHFLKKAKRVEEKDKKWVEVCEYDHEDKKHVTYHVVFKDDNDRKGHGRDKH